MLQMDVRSWIHALPNNNTHAYLTTKREESSSVAWDLFRSRFHCCIFLFFFTKKTYDGFIICQKTSTLYTRRLCCLSPNIVQLRNASYYSVEINMVYQAFLSRDLSYLCVVQILMMLVLTSIAESALSSTQRLLLSCQIPKGIFSRSWSTEN